MSAKSSNSPAIVWFRRDLRVSDNPALTAASHHGPVICVYIEDTETPKLRRPGGAQKTFLHDSLAALETELAKRHHKLILRRGAPLDILKNIVEETGATGLFWNRLYDKPSIERDGDIKDHFKQAGLAVESFNGALLYEPWEVLKDDGTYYKVFTPFWKNARATKNPMPPLPAPKLAIADHSLQSEALGDWDLLPPSAEPDWADDMRAYWQAGETAAREKLETFIKGPLNGYKEDRNLPHYRSTSELSPYLHMGAISPRQCWDAVYDKADAPSGKDAQHFLSELGWREFCTTILFYNPDLAHQNFQAKFDDFPWVNNEAGLEAWQKGQTGYPIVDAGMRQLWHLGWMHNRVRMITASFLIKDLMLHWRHGEQWFWDTLVDADPANNPAGWQWVAGTGTDAAPYFRVFNPFTQGEKFDPEGEYVKRWCPELKDMPKKYVHRPWEAPQEVLDKAGVTLGDTYPRPLVDHKKAREEALSAFKGL